MLLGFIDNVPLFESFYDVEDENRSSHKENQIVGEG